MNWIPTLSPLQWMVLSAVPPLIVLLYFLKLRRTPLEVPSTYLWTRTLEDLHVNSIWQRLRNNLLLLLQLLLLAFLILACLRPGCQGEQLRGDRFIFLLDNSASMSATDLPGGQTRLDAAKKEISRLIDRLKPSDAAMIISFSDRAVVQQSYVRNKTQLKRKLAAIAPTQRASDLSEALLAASGLANPGRTSFEEGQDVQVADALLARLFIFSDGGVNDVPSFSLGNLTPEYRPIGAVDPPHNVGITAFSINRQLDSAGQVQAFARLQNCDDVKHQVSVTLYVDDIIFDAQSNIEIPAEGTTRLNFDLSGILPELTAAVPVRLQIDGQDALMQDNRAYNVLQPPRQANVLVVSRYNRFLELVMQTDAVKRLAVIEFQTPEFLQSKDYLERATLGLYDLVIFEQCAPEKMPLSNTVLIDAVPPGDRWQRGEKQWPTPIIDLDISHPLMFNIQMGNVTVVEGRPVSGPPGTLALVESTYGSIMSIAPRSGFEDLVLGFPFVEFDQAGEGTVNTDWPNNLSFPLFIQNLLITLAGGASFEASQGNRTGELVNVKTQFPTNAVSVRDPRGQTTTLSARPDQTFVYAGTEQTGIYAVSQAGAEEVDQLFAVNLLDSRESDLTVRDKLEIGYQEVTGNRTAEPARQEYWTWLILIGMAVLVFEWLVYNRRVFI